MALVQNPDDAIAGIERDEEREDQMEDALLELRSLLLDMRDGYGLFPTYSEERYKQEIKNDIEEYVDGMVGVRYESEDIDKIYKIIVDKYIKGQGCLDEKHLKSTIVSNIPLREGGRRKTRKIKKAKKVKKTKNPKARTIRKKIQLGGYRMKERILEFKKSSRLGKKYEVLVQDLKTKKNRIIHFGAGDKDRTPLKLYSHKNHRTPQKGFTRRRCTPVRSEAIELEKRKSKGYYNPKILSHEYLW